MLWAQFCSITAVLSAILHGCSDRSCRQTRTCPSDDSTQTASGANQPDASVAAGNAIDDGTDPATAGSAVCPVGEHLCGGRCVSSFDPTSCGTSCFPCEAPIEGVASCDGVRCGGRCGPGQELCAGACIDADTPCTRSCPAGTHECNGLCPSDQSVNACGASCDPCSVPDGADQAACNGQECSFLCAVGQHRCGDTCKRDTDVLACGDPCTPCPAYENGFAACNDGTCTVWCNAASDSNPAGFHVCDEQCVPSDSPTSCGSSCEPCTVPEGGEATCTEGECGATCPTGQSLCFGTCVDQDAACEGSCPDGTHDCDGLCVLDTNATRCGEACVACDVPVGASLATCIEDVCGISGCRPGFHQCGDECVVDDDATACGPECVQCPGDPNDVSATPLCRDDRCTLECDATQFHLCSDGVCHRNDDTEACGPSCAVCTVPAGGIVSCNGTTCIPDCPDLTIPKLCNGECIAEDVACDGQCPAGTHNCGGLCVDDEDTGSCGTSCDACAVPTSGSATCLPEIDGELLCGIDCEPGFHACDDETCESDSNAGACGPTCAVCPAPPPVSGASVGEPVCADGACDISCIAGYHQCADTTRCAADTDAIACGPNCVACSSPTPVCFAGACRECDPTLNPRPRRCTGNTPEECSDSGTFVPQAACSGNTPECNPTNGQCRCAEGTCFAGTPDSVCSGGNIVSCGADTPVCSAGSCGCDTDPTQCPNNRPVCSSAQNECINTTTVNGTFPCGEGTSCGAGQRCCINAGESSGTCQSTAGGAFCDINTVGTYWQIGCDQAEECPGAPAGSQLQGATPVCCMRRNGLGGCDVVASNACQDVATLSYGSPVCNPTLSDAQGLNTYCAAVTDEEIEVFNNPAIARRDYCIPFSAHVADHLAIGNTFSGEPPGAELIDFLWVCSRFAP